MKYYQTRVNSVPSFFIAFLYIFVVLFGGQAKAAENLTDNQPISNLSSPTNTGNTVSSIPTSVATKKGSAKHKNHTASKQVAKAKHQNKTNTIHHKKPKKESQKIHPKTQNKAKNASKIRIIQPLNNTPIENSHSSKVSKLKSTLLHVGEISTHTVAHSLGTAGVKVVAWVHHTMQNLHQNRYRFGGGKFDISKGIYEIDCSRFIDHLLERATPAAYACMVHHTGVAKPTSADYFSFFRQLPHEKIWHSWYRVPTVFDLQPGDVLVFRGLTPDLRRAANHIMLVVDQPKRQGKLSDVFLLRIADSAPIPHSHDTRPKNTSGIGIGTLLLKVDPTTGEPEAYSWGLSKRWNYQVTFAMARPMLEETGHT